MFRVARHTAHRTVTDCEDYHAVLAVADQWTQLKTGRDSPDFRRWANPFTFMTTCYENRVVTRLDFDTKEEFAQQIEDLVKFHARTTPGTESTRGATTCASASSSPAPDAS